MSSEFGDNRKVNDIVVKLKEGENGKMEITGLRMFITGTSGQHIASFYKGEKPNCSCLGFRTHNKCIHVAATDILMYCFNQVIPLLEVDKVFEKVKT